MPTLGYLRDTETDERVDFQFNPSDLPVTLGVSYASKSPRGSSHPRLHYSHSEGRSESIELTWMRQDPRAFDIVALRKRLQSLTFPDYDAGGRLARGPHPMLLVFGGLTTLRVKIKSIKLTQGPWFDPETTAPGELRAVIEWVEQPAEGDLSRAAIAGGR